MAQTTSYEIDNDSGAVVRGRLNDVLAAIQSSNSGPTPPANTAPGMLWLDTSDSPSVLYRRNAADSDWIPVAPDVEIASEAEAEAGTDNAKLMTPLRTAQAIAELSPAPSELTQAQVEDSTSTVFGTVSGQRLEQQTNAAFNVTGAAPKYACRAWVNFNGTTSTPTIRASGNVSSVTRNATGLFTINFTTAMPDTDYLTTVTGSGFSDATQAYIGTEGQSGINYAQGKTTSSNRCYFTNTQQSVNPISGNVAIFR